MNYKENYNRCISSHLNRNRFCSSTSSSHHIYTTEEEICQRQHTNISSRVTFLSSEGQADQFPNPHSQDDNRVSRKSSRGKEKVCQVG